MLGGEREERSINGQEKRFKFLQFRLTPEIRFFISGRVCTCLLCSLNL